MSRTTINSSMAVLGLLASNAIAIPAFSGATGPGAIATGGRGGDVYHVTTLDPDLAGTIPGSFQYGMNNAPSAGRTIVFDVGGTIYLAGQTAASTLRYGKSNITVAGQTAPGPGITIAGTATKWTGTNVICRNMTIRPNLAPVTYDAFSLQTKGSIFDHVSATWFTDEGISITDAGENSTIQYANISEGLNDAGHSFGSIIATEVDGTNYSYNHNLYAHNTSRMPRIGSEVSTTFPLTIGARLDFTNNVIYNWNSSKAGYSGTDQPSRSNFINNYYIKGTNASTNIFAGGDLDTGAAFFTDIYQSGNKFDTNKNGAIDGPTVGSSAFTGTWRAATEYPVPGVANPDSADTGLQRTLDYGGANWWNRNPIDARIFNSVRAGTGAGINDLTDATHTAEWNVVLAQRTAVTRAAGWDTDKDGMPDTWEQKHNLNPSVADNNGDFDTDGYTNLEEYINEVAEWPAAGAVTWNGGAGRYELITNWGIGTTTATSNRINWQPSKYDEAQIGSGTVGVTSVGQHANILKIAPTAGQTAELDIDSGWLEVGSEIVIGGTATSNATLKLRGGQLVAKKISKSTSGSMLITGGTLQAEQITFPVTNNGGTISPGIGVGSLTVTGNLVLNSGKLQFDLLSATSFDQLNVTGNITRGGALEVLLNSGFTPAAGDRFKIMTATGLYAGDFSSITSGYRLEQSGTDTFLVVLPEPASMGLIALATTALMRRRK